MDLYKEILTEILSKEKVTVRFENIDIKPSEIIELSCYQALQKIRAILDNDTLEDNECFLKIEEIICLFERLGSDGGSRHDFG